MFLYEIWRVLLFNVNEHLPQERIPVSWQICSLLPLTPHSSRPFCLSCDHGTLEAWRGLRTFLFPGWTFCSYRQLAKPSTAATFSFSTTSGRTDADVCVVWPLVTLQEHVCTHLTTYTHPSCFLWILFWHKLLINFKFMTMSWLLIYQALFLGDKGQLFA